MTTQKHSATQAYRDGYDDGLLLQNLPVRYLDEAQVEQLMAVMQEHYRQTHSGEPTADYLPGVREGFVFRLTKEEFWGIVSSDETASTAWEPGSYDINTHFSFYRDGQQIMKALVEELCSPQKPRPTIPVGTRIRITALQAPGYNPAFSGVTGRVVPTEEAVDFERLLATLTPHPEYAHLGFAYGNRPSVIVLLQGDQYEVIEEA